MAITIVSSIATAAASGANITIPLDGAQTNDIVVTWGGFAGGTATAPGVISPAGYTSVLVVDSAGVDTKVEWKRLNGTPDPSVLLAGSGDAADAGAYGMFLLRGVTTAADPFDIAVRSSIASGVPQAPSVITVTAGAMVLALAANDVFDSSPGTVTNFSANITATANDNDDQTVGGAASIISAAGTISPTAWSTWAAGVYNGITLAFRPAAIPTVQTSFIGSIAATTAIGQGNVTADGGAPILERGFAWNVTGSPTTADSHANTAGTTGVFQSSITGLTAASSYYGIAYAINNIGSAYGTQQLFTSSTASANPPTVTSATQVNCQNTYFIASGSVTSDGGAAVTERGFAFSTNANPSLSDKTFPITGTTGGMAQLVTNLAPNTTYNYRAYAVNSVSSGFGSNVQFTTNTTPMGQFNGPQGQPP